MNRRSFLQAGSAASLAATASLTVGSASSPKTGESLRDRIKIAVKFHMVTEDLSVLDKFKLLRDLGFDGTEVRTTGKTNQKEIAAAVQRTGLPVHGVVNSSSPDLRRAIELARYYGGDSVLIVAEPQTGRSYDESFQHWQSLIRSALPLAERHQVHLLVENVRATFLKTAEEMARFIDECNSPLVGSYFDTGNTITWTEQSAQHWARVLGNRIGKLDIKDRGHAQFGDVKLKSETAQGTDGGEVHWVDVRQALDQSEFSGWATAEVRGGDRTRLAGISNWMNDVLSDNGDR